MLSEVGLRDVIKEVRQCLEYSLFMNTPKVEKTDSPDCCIVKSVFEEVFQKCQNMGLEDYFFGVPQKGSVSHQPRDFYGEYHIILKEICFIDEFYRNKQGVNKTFATVFKELLEYKSAYELCSDRTIYGWERYYARYLYGLGDHIISKITDDDLNEYIISHILPDHPKVDILHHAIFCMKKVFWFARKKGYISTNPEAGIDYKDYRRHADRSKKREEDTYFTAEETEAIRLRAWECIENPRALIILLCIETGMRADEPVALHVEDIHEGYIEIHRQQIRLDGPKPYKFVEVDYTKDTRNAADPCRYFPITPRIQEIINAAMQLPGESKYLFHDAQGNMIKKDSYELYLRRFVTKLGIKGKTNNHAFRKGLNTNVLIPRGVPVNERAALLGHSVRTNERNYSPRKKDALEGLRAILSGHENGQ